MVNSKAGAQADTYSISGTIKPVERESKKPLASAAIRLLTPSDSFMVHGTTSDGNGSYHIRNITPRQSPAEIIEQIGY